MTRVVYKFSLPEGPIGAFEIDMQEGAEILTVQMQYGAACIWALVDPEAPLKPRRLAIMGTGHPTPDAGAGRYIGTFQMLDGGLVWHLFEEYAP